jgi:hypothetical protein
MATAHVDKTQYFQTPSFILEQQVSLASARGL